MRPALAAFVVASATALSGCADAIPFSPASADSPSYRLLLVDAEHRTASPSEGAGVCGFASTPEVDESARTITFHGAGPDPAQTRALVLVVAWDRTHCGTADTTWASLSDAVGVTRVDLPGLGEVAVEFLEDGRVLVDGMTVTPGGIRIDASGETSSASAEFRSLGAWPTDGLRIV